ncbi:MAG: hypothetical protein E7I48_16430 [Clostridium celatum]|nr:hypothetical protein [Clostridium celatum]
MKIKNVLKGYKFSLIVAKKNIEKQTGIEARELNDLIDKLEIIIKNIEER